MWIADTDVESPRSESSSPRLLRKTKQTISTVMSRHAIPPTAPPTMMPRLLLLLAGAAVSSDVPLAPETDCVSTSIGLGRVVGSRVSCGTRTVAGVSKEPLVVVDSLGVDNALVVVVAVVVDVVVVVDVAVAVLD
jgi:hypothetical protein